MDKDSVLKLLENVAAPILRIEEKIGMPRSTLQKVIDGDRDLPKEWALKLKDFVEKRQYIGLKRKKKKEVVLEVVKEKPAEPKKEAKKEDKDDWSGLSKIEKLKRMREGY